MSRRAYRTDGTRTGTETGSGATLSWEDGEPQAGKDQLPPGRYDPRMPERCEPVRDGGDPGRLGCARAVPALGPSEEKRAVVQEFQGRCERPGATALTDLEIAPITFE